MIRYLWRTFLIALHRDHAVAVADAVRRWHNAVDEFDAAVAERDNALDQCRDLESQLNRAEQRISTLTYQLENAQQTIREHEATIRIQGIEAKGLALVNTAQNERLREFIAKSAAGRYPSADDRSVEPYLTG